MPVRIPPFFLLARLFHLAVVEPGVVSVCFAAVFRVPDSNSAPPRYRSERFVISPFALALEALGIAIRNLL
jgi:hypothetical protein